jgi:VanZ family protein
MTADATRLKPGPALGRFCRYVLPLCLWMGFIFLMSTNAGSARSTNEPLVAVLAFLWPEVGHFSSQQHWLLIYLCRKLGHILEYAILTWLVVRAVQQDNPRWNWRTAAVALLFAVLHAAADEWHQAFVPSRTSNLRDVGIDSVGALAALVVAWFWYRGRDPLARYERLAQLRREGLLTEAELYAAREQLEGRQ